MCQLYISWYPKKQAYSCFPHSYTHTFIQDPPASQLIFLILVMVVDSEAQGNFCQLGPGRDGMI